MTGIMFARVHARAVRAFARAFTYAKTMPSKALPCLLAAVLSCVLVPASAFAEGESEDVDASAEGPQEVSAEQVDEGSSAALMLASGLVGSPSSFVSADVPLDGEPVVGSFTVDGLTFAVAEGSDVELVGVAYGWQQVAGSQEGDGSPVAPTIASGPDGLDADGAMLVLPELISYEGVDYAVASIGAYAFYLSGVTAVELPATVADVDERAFRSSDVATVRVAEGNGSYASYDGVLYDAAMTSLLLIPEGRSEGVRIPYTAEEVAAAAFSHASAVAAISVDADSPTYSSEDGLLYNADGTVLLRVPAGAVKAIVREGCTAIAAGALEGCAKLERINAPASVASISPDVFANVPTVSLPAVAAVADDPGASTGATEEPSEQAGSTPASISATTQLTAMVALSSADDDLPEVDPSAIEVSLPEGADGAAWEAHGFVVTRSDGLVAELGSSAAYSAYTRQILVNDYARGYLTVTKCYNVPGAYSSDTSQSAIATSYSSTSYRLSSSNMGSVGGSGAYAMYAAPSYQTISQGDGYTGGQAFARTGNKFMGWSTSASASTGSASLNSANAGSFTVYAIFAGVTYHVAFDANGGALLDGQAKTLTAVYGNDITLPTAVRTGYRFTGWGTEADGTGNLLTDGTASNLTTTEGATVNLYAQWEILNVDISFDTSSEPGDEDYLGEAKDDQTVTGSQIEAGEKVEIADPKRPGYVFQGWVIPSTDGTEAIDQELVYQDEADGKWYVDASKLPDYVNDEGRVELTARWTSVISVDVPSAVTFYADIVTQGNESREGAASSAFGQNKVASQSEVDLRIVGLESAAVAMQGSTLGADSILKKSASATPSSSTQKLFSLYPTDKALTPDDLQDPDAVSQAKPSGAVDFALDDLLLEKSFVADAFTIPAGDTLNLGYRLNLAETGTELDYDILSTLDEGTSASIANISYCFAADYGPVFWTTDDDGSTLELAAIKADAEAIAAGDSAAISKYTRWMNADHRFYVKWYDKGVTEAANPTAATVYDVRIIGLNHDDKSDGSGKAGITFQFVDCLKDAYRMNQGNVATSAWIGSELRARMNPGTSAVASGTDDDAIWSQVPTALADRIVQVDKTVWTGTAVWIVAYQSATVTSSTAKASDHLFLVPEAGMRRLDTYARFDLYIKKSIFLEGGLYGYYDPIAPSGDVEWDIMTKRLGPDGGVASWWWCCSHSPNPANTSSSFISIDSSGGSAHATTASTALGVCPAFCL